MYGIVHNHRCPGAARRVRMERYQDKKVVIIGGTSGMGLATAKMLLAGGARVLVTENRESVVKSLSRAQPEKLGSSHSR